MASPSDDRPSTVDDASLLSPDDLCGRSLLALVAAGHAMAARIRTLSDRVPLPYWAASRLPGPRQSGPGGSNEARQQQQRQRSKSTSSGEVGGLFNLFGPSRKAGSEGAPEDKTGGDELSDARKYAPFLFDFNYLHNPEEYEASLLARARDGPGEDRGKTAAGGGGGSNGGPAGLDLAQLEREFTVNQSKTVVEFYELFESVVGYHTDLSSFVDDLNRGYYIRHTVESVLSDEVGRRLVCEAVYLWGVLLITMEHYLPGPVRERLVISYHRMVGRDPSLGDISKIDSVVALCRSSAVRPPATAHRSSHKHPADEMRLFARFSLPSDFVRNVVGCLLSSDIYRRSTTAFPSIDHRSVALAGQASILYVVLYFDPHALREENAKMRSVVDRFFGDNWVVHVYGGLTADLGKEWGRYGAARAAMAGVLGEESVRGLHVGNAKLIGQCMAELRAYLTMGILTDGFVLDNRRDLLNCLRRCNIALRWRILHRRTADVALREIICAKQADGALTTDPKLEGDFAVSESHVISLLLLTSQLEMQLKDTFRQLLERREDIWSSCKTRTSGMMSDLAGYFGGGDGDGGSGSRAAALSKVDRHEGLSDWFAAMADEVNALSYESGEHVTVRGRRIQHCVQSLEEIELFDVVDRDVQARAFVGEARGMLLQMARAVGISSGVLDDMAWISDMSYGVECIRSYVDIIHARISKDPANVSLLQGFFLKLSTSSDGPIERPTSGTPGGAGVSDYYSSKLISFVRTVLSIVPVSVFAIIVQMSDIFERRLQPLPLRVPVEKLSSFAQLGERYKLSMMAHEVSIFANGILNMETTRIGGKEISPREFLEEGIRREMVSHVAELFNNLLQFDFAADAETVSSMNKHQAAAMRSLNSLGGRLEGLQRALVSVEDYISIPGLTMWHEETARILNYNVEQEVNKYLLKKVLDVDSRYQSNLAPIPRFPRTENEATCINFTGRVVSMLVKITDAQYATFSLERSGWYSADGSVVFGRNNIALLRKAIGVIGLTGIDRLLCYRILHELHRLVKFFRTNVTKQGMLLEQLRDELSPQWKTTANSVAIYHSGSKKTEMLMLPMLTCFRRVGQSQLLRRMIKYELQRCASKEAKLFQQKIEIRNAEILISELIKDELDVSEVKELSLLTNAIGLGDPINTIFMTTDPMEGLPVLLLFFVINYVPKLSYDPVSGSLAKVKSGYPIDGWPIVAGISTLLRQFHPSYTKAFLGYVGQFIRLSVQTYVSRKQEKKEGSSRLAADLKTAIVMMEQLCDLSNLPDSDLYEHVPQYLIEMCSEI